MKCFLIHRTQYTGALQSELPYNMLSNQMALDLDCTCWYMQEDCDLLYQICRPNLIVTPSGSVDHNYRQGNLHDTQGCCTFGNVVLIQGCKICRLGFLHVSTAACSLGVV